MTYTIGEVAERSGFSASALRYYEDIGLVAPAARTDAGYRLYDDRALSRLAFVARAKDLGCSLEEITELLPLWDGDECGTAQRRLHDLVTAKLADARRRAVELTVLTGQLVQAAGNLSGPAPDGPCGPGCACLATAPTAAATEPVPVAAPVIASAPVPIACTLDAGEMPERLDDWRSVLGRVTGRTATEDGGLRLTFDPDADVAALAGLIAAEQGCCAFFAFALTVDQRGVALEVRAPEDAEPVVAALFGTAA
jgi:MerR family transcriptional regulator, copper efflux regulator